MAGKGSSEAARRRPRSRRPRAPRRRRSFGLSGRGRILLIAGLCFIAAAYPLARTELLYLGSLLAGMPLLALAFVRFRRQRMGVARHFSPAVAEAGSPVRVAVEVRNLGSAKTGEAGWRDEWPWSPYGTPTARLRPLTRNRGPFGQDSAVLVDYVLDPPRRGVFEIGPLVVDFGDPFQLARGEIVVGARQKLVVTPRIAILPVTGQSIAADEGSARALQRRNTGGEDELMTREYRYGDPLRRVHWRASAHHGELMVRQEEQRSHAQARILLDTRRAGYRDTAPPVDQEPESDSFEWAVSFAASLALHLQRIGFTVEVIETGLRQLSSPEHPEDFLESLAAVSLVDERPGRGILSLLPDPGRALGSVFAIVADAEPHTVDRLVAQRAQFDVAIAFVVNPHNEIVLGPLHDAGWICIAVRPTDDLAAVWLAAAELREVRRARA
ncbi:DUF58 domain-containing protein [Leifsonia bigeumensis]|uniref:DUF58 domain-containing protein n=1 Tax=Leifsonella bigeumensis TaxID=433643 RepID=A0ABP7G391_9MICO